MNRYVFILSKKESFSILENRTVSALCNLEEASNILRSKNVNRIIELKAFIDQHMSDIARISVAIESILCQDQSESGEGEVREIKDAVNN